MVETERINKALAQLEELGLEQMIVYEPYALYYFTGRRLFGGERFVALLLKKDGGHKLFLNRMIPCESLELDIVWLDDTDDGPAICASYLDESKALGVDKDFPARFLIPIIKKCPGMIIENGSIAVDKTRQCKDEKEQELMFMNSRLNDLAMDEFKKLIKPGVTERMIADEMPGIYKRLGADRFGFGIVAFGKNAADPHHMPDDTILQDGDAVLFDVGAIKDMYNSDMTRTFFFRGCTDKMREVYNVVRRANEEAEKSIKPGMRYCDVDKVARDIITEAGYGEYFTHRLGHNIGLTCHEYGDCSKTNTDVLKPGMFFSIEPGVYLPGEFGVRVEDLIMVTEDGCKVLNSYSKELEIV